MRKFSKVEHVFVETTDASSPSLTKKTQSSATAGHSRLLIQTVTWWGDFQQVGACVMSGLIQVSDMAKGSVSLSEINFVMAGYLLFIDLMFA